MAMNDVCPQCGTPVDPGATVCTACGRELPQAESAVPPAAAPPPADPPPPAPPSASPVATPASPASADVRALYNEARERWGVTQPNFLVLALVFALVAFVVGTLANISYLTAGDNSTSQKFDAQVWLQLALGASIAAAALLLLVRLQSGGAARASELDLRIGYGLAGLTIAFCLAGLFKGLDESFEALDSWFAYARIYAFLTIGWLTVSRPVPETIGAVKATAAGLAVIGVSAVALVIGQIQGLSENNSSYLSGISFQHLGVIGMLLAFAWFLGMRPATD